MQKKGDKKVHTWCVPSQCIPIACGTIQYVAITFTTNRPGIPIYDSRLQETYFPSYSLSCNRHLTSGKKSDLRLENETDHSPQVSGKIYKLYFLILFPSELPRRIPCKRDKVAVWICTKRKKQQHDVNIVCASIMCILQSYTKDSKEISWSTVGV